METQSNWIELSKGLYAEMHAFIVKGITYYNCILHADDGYCFYDVDEEEDVRNYSTWCKTPITDIMELRRKYISVLETEKEN